MCVYKPHYNRYKILRWQIMYDYVIHILAFCVVFLVLRFKEHVLFDVLRGSTLLPGVRRSGFQPFPAALLALPRNCSLVPQGPCKVAHLESCFRRRKAGVESPQMMWLALMISKHKCMSTLSLKASKWWKLVRSCSIFQIWGRLLDYRLSQINLCWKDCRLGLS